MNFQFLALVAAAASIVGCAAPSASPEVVVVELRRPAVPLAQVKVYQRPPKKYKEITVIESSSKGSLATTNEDKINVVIERIKSMAAMLGANGIMIRSMGGPSGGSVGAASVNGGGVAADTMPKVGSATAIYVEQE